MIWLITCTFHVLNLSNILPFPVQIMSPFRTPAVIGPFYNQFLDMFFNPSLHWVHKSRLRLNVTSSILMDFEEHTIYSSPPLSPSSVRSSTLDPPSFLTDSLASSPSCLNTFPSHKIPHAFFCLPKHRCSPPALLLFSHYFERRLLRYSRILVLLVNQTRAKYALNPLSVSERLAGVAKRFAMEPSCYEKGINMRLSRADFNPQKWDNELFGDFAAQIQGSLCGGPRMVHRWFMMNWEKRRIILGERFEEIGVCVMRSKRGLLNWSVVVGNARVWLRKIREQTNYALGRKWKSLLRFSVRLERLKLETKPLDYHCSWTCSEIKACHSAFPRTRTRSLLVIYENLLRQEYFNVVSFIPLPCQYEKMGGVPNYEIICVSSKYWRLI